MSIYRDIVMNSTEKRSVSRDNKRYEPVRKKNQLDDNDGVNDNASDEHVDEIDSTVQATLRTRDADETNNKQFTKRFIPRSTGVKIMRIFLKFVRI